MKLLTVILLFLGLVSCKLSRLDTPKGDMTVRIQCIQNHMPMSSQSSYVILQFFPADTVFQEGFKILEVRAAGSNGTWMASSYDHTEYLGKDQKFVENVARDFNPNIGGLNSFQVVIQFESGEKKQFEVKDVSILHVS